MDLRLPRAAVIACALALSQQILAAGGLKLDFSPDPLARFRKPPKLRLTCPTAAKAPVIDAKLDDAAWRRAAVIEGITGSAPRTTARVCADARALYIGVTCWNPRGRPPRAKVTEPDGPVWQDDCVEVWIAPDIERLVSFQFVVNCANVHLDSMNFGGRVKLGHSPRWDHAVDIGPKAWTVEMAIPFAAAEMDGWRRRIGFNIGRNGRGMRAAAWNGKYGDATSSVLILPDAPEPKLKALTQQAAADDAKVASVGEGLRVSFERLAARPGERWIEGKLRVNPRGSLRACRLVARLLDLGTGRPVEEVTVTPARASGTLAADLRRHGMAEAELEVALYEGSKLRGKARAFLSARGPEEPLKPGARIPVKIDAPDGAGDVENWPVTFGVPFAPGALWDVAELRLVDTAGREAPSQREAIGWWAPEGSVKWVRFDSLVNSRGRYYVEARKPTSRSKPSPEVTVRKRGADIVVDTGAAQYTLGRGPSPIKEIRRGGRVVVTSRGARGLYVMDQKGALATASSKGETMLVESRGPVAACVKFEGFYAGRGGRPVARHATRLEFFAGRPEARITHTFTLSQDTNKVWFKDVGWELAVAPGAEPKASFGIARDDWRKSMTQPLGANEALSMLQDSHYRQGHGKNHFSVDRIDLRGRAKKVLEGAECGDWAALHGGEGGFMVSCREAARQHPKEFAVARDRVALHLFSSRGGEQLDFRMPALIKRWDLKNWHEKTHSKTRRVPIVKRALKNHSNAQGWSRTSFLTFAPLAPQRPVETAKRLSRLTTAQVFAHTDPKWLCASGAMGAIHPKDTARFPDAERAIDAAFRFWEKRIGLWGDYGFVDYFNGPHLGYRGPGGRYVAQKRYSKAMYTLKVDLWRVYARSADRNIRTYIENVARTFMDVDMAQWDGDGRIRGLFHHPPASDLRPSMPGNLPMPWAGRAGMNYSSTTNLDLVAWDYYLTGNRQAKDMMVAFGEGAKRLWTPAVAAREFRVLMTFRTLVQSYAFTWDPVLRAMAKATADQFYDPQCALSLTKNRPYSSTYKTQVDIRAIADGWNVLGERRYHEILTKIAERWWTPLLGQWPHFYCNPQGVIGSFFYNETGKPSYAQALATQLRYSASAYDPKKDHTYGCESAASCTFVFEGLPYAMATITRSGCDREAVGSWIGYEDFGYPSSVVVWKGGEESVDLHWRSTGKGGKGGPGSILGPGPTLELINPRTYSQKDTLSIRRESAGAAHVRLTKDAPEGAYRLTAPAKGTHLCYADSRAPMVVHAPEYWRPAPAQQPAVRYYFRLPKGEKEGHIFFEGSAKLFDPDGRPWKSGKPQSGWVALPEDKPGVWSFLPVANEIVGSRNIPPFFAVGSAASYFDPGIPWTRRPAPSFKRPDPKLKFVEGAFAGPGNRAVQLTGRRRFRLLGGAPHASGDGLRFLPLKKGTIEFWMKPNWHTCALQPKGWKCLVHLPVAKGLAWSLWHYVKPRARMDNLDFLYSHVLYGWFYSDGVAKLSTMRRYRRTVFEPGEWYHVAWVWGQEDGLVPGNPPYHTKVRNNVLIARIFVNGKQGSTTGYRWYKNQPCQAPISLEIGRGYASGNIDAAVDELRISDVQRYGEDFTPSREAEFKPDTHTRALFHFNGDLKGVSYGYKGTLPAKLAK